MELRTCGGQIQGLGSKRRSRALSVSGRGDGMFGILIESIQERGTDQIMEMAVHSSIYLASPKPSA
jgi:hypothetical protein